MPLFEPSNRAPSIDRAKLFISHLRKVGRIDSRGVGSLLPPGQAKSSQAAQGRRTLTVCFRGIGCSIRPEPGRESGVKRLQQKITCRLVMILCGERRAKRRVPNQILANEERIRSE